MTEDEKIGQYHQFNRPEFEDSPGDGEGQGNLVCCSPWVTKSQTQLSKYNSIPKKKKKKDLKIGKKAEQSFSQRRHTDGQQAHEQMLNILNHLGNANQNHSELSSHACQNGSYQKYHR